MAAPRHGERLQIRLLAPHSLEYLRARDGGASSVASARPPPADSPSRSARRAAARPSGPCSRIQRTAATAPSSAAGNGCSGASRYSMSNTTQRLREPHCAIAIRRDAAGHIAAAVQEKASAGCSPSAPRGAPLRAGPPGAAGRRFSESMTPRASPGITIHLAQNHGTHPVTGVGSFCRAKSRSTCRAAQSPRRTFHPVRASLRSDLPRSAGPSGVTDPLHALYVPPSWR